MNLSIKGLLVALSSILVIIIMLLGGAVYVTNAGLSKTVEFQSQAQLEYQRLRDFESLWGGTRAKGYAWMISRRGPQMDEYLASRDKLDEIRVQLSGLDADLITEINTLVESYYTDLEELNEGLRGRNTNPAVSFFLKEMIPDEERMDEILSMETERLASITQESSDAVLNGFTRADLMTAILVAASILIAALLSFVIVHVVIKRVQSLVGTIEQISANKDLRTRSKILPGEIGVISKSMNQLTEDIATTLKRVQSVSSALSESALSQTKASNQLVSISSDQNVQAAEMDNQLQSMNSNMQSVNESFSMVKQDAEQIGDVTERSSQSVRNALEGFNSLINQSETFKETLSEHQGAISKIPDLIGSISDISDHTNLLALNAAIEAARAGEQGRGFAVVADEVRSLSVQTAQATDQVRNLVGSIQDSASRVESQVMSVFNQLRSNSELTQEGMRQTEAVRSGVAKIIELANHSAEEITLMGSELQQTAKFAKSIQAGALQVSNSSKELLSQNEQSLDLSKELQQRAMDFKVAEES